MRHPFALLAAVILACTPVSQQAELSTFDPTRASETLACEPGSPGFEPPASVERMTAASDSSLVLVYPDAREVVLVDGNLSPIHTLRLEPEGPTGIAALHDAAVLGDSLVVVADGPRRLLRAFTPEGDPAWAVRLPAIPDRVLPTPAGLAVFPLHLAGLPGGGAYLVRDGAAHDLGMKPVALDDPQMGTLANLVSPALARGTSRLIVPRQFIAPVAALVDLDTATLPRTVPMPVAEATADRAWWAPGPPYTDGEMQRIIAPAMSATSGPGTGEISVLTRTGVHTGEHLEKVVIRLDSELRVMSSMTLPFNAIHLAWLASEHAYYIMTADEGWYRCSLPSPPSLLEPE